MVVVHEASFSDREGAATIFAKVHAHFTRIATIFAGQGYTGKLIALVHTTHDDQYHQRTERRLAKDYERYPKHSEAFVYIAMSNIVLHRLARGF